MKMVVRTVIYSLLLALAPSAFAEEPLQLARDFLADLRNENNMYAHHGYIHWKGERGWFSDYTENEARIDCSGFVNAILKKAGSPSYDKVYSGTHRKGAPKAENYYEAITQNIGFVQRANLSEVRPGDIFAVKFPAGASDTGHVVFVDEKPERMEGSVYKQIEGMTLWKLTVIDASGNHGVGDTRVLNGKPSSGVGRGSYRLYVDDAGQVVAFASMTKAATVRDSEHGYLFAFGALMQARPED